jgi:MFS family permease
MMSRDRGGRGRFVRGWAVIAGVCALMAIASGLGFYNASVYLEAIVVERGIPIGVMSWASATFFVLFGLAGLPISRWVSDRDPRPVMLAGAVLGGLALMGLGAATRAWQLFGVFAILGVAFSAISFVPGTVLINRWFVRRRTLALALATTGLSIGGIAITPVSARAIERTDLAQVSPWLALTWTLGVVLVVAVAIRPWPESYGLTPDGDPASEEPEGPVRGLTPGAVYRTHTYRWLTAGVTLLMLSQVGALAHLYGIGVERADAATAATAVSTVAFSSVVGRMLGIWILQHLEALWFTVALAALQVVSMSLLAIDGGAPALLLATSIFGLSVGNLLVVIPIVLVESFGSLPYARVYAANQLVGSLGVASGPILFGMLRDATGTYSPGAASAAGVSLLACALLVLTHRTRTREGLPVSTEPATVPEEGPTSNWP